MVWFEKNFIPIPSEYVDREGFLYATKLAGKAQFISLLFQITGWLLIMLGILLGVAGSVLGTDPVMPDDSLDQLNEALQRLISQRGLICNTFAIIMAGLGRQFLERAKASAKLASVGTKAIACSSRKFIIKDKEGTQQKIENPDRMAYEACVMAKAIWLEGRVDDTQLNQILNKLGQETVPG
jgi:hypothetical protein